MMRGPRDPLAPGRFVLSVLAVGFLGTPTCHAKPPTLLEWFPPGAARGSTTNIKVSGTFDHWPSKVWVEGGGVEFQAEREKGSFKVIVASDAPPGTRWTRLYDEDGASSLRPLVIGQLPEILEAEPNDDSGSPQRLDSHPVTINGRLARPGDVDGFGVDLARGATLVAAVDAERHLGSPIDAVLQVVSPDGSVRAQNDDDVGRDPRIIFEAPSAGTYIVRLFAFPAKPDSSIRFAGGNEFVYRLTLTTRGFLDYVYPLAVGRDRRRVVEAVGWNIPSDARSISIVEDDTRDVSTVFHPSIAGTADLRRVPFAAIVETEPNELSQPQAIAGPVALSGRIDPPGDQDVFRLSLRKGNKWVFRVESHALGRPLDPTLRVLDSGGKILADADDTGRNNRDLERPFTAPDDGEYRLIVRDLNGRGGPRYAYLLSVLEPDSEFALNVATDKFDLTPGKPSKIVVAVQRKDGFAEPIEIVAEGLPPGVTAKPITSQSGDASARSVTLELTASGARSQGPLRIVGRTPKDTRASRAATAVVAGFEAKTEWFWLTSHSSASGRST